MSEPCKCSEKFAAIQEAQWQQIKTMSALMERIEREGDRLQELYREAEHDRQQMQVAFIEQFLRKRIDEKKGAKSDNRITFNKVEKHIS